MVKYTNECCGCDADLYPCNPAQCGLTDVPNYICDCCGDDVGYNHLYHFDDEELCIGCIKDRLVKVE